MHPDADAWWSAGPVQACGSWPIREDWAFQEEGFKRTGTKMEHMHMDWIEVLQQ